MKRQIEKAILAQAFKCPDITFGKVVVLPVLHKIIINKDDTNLYCNLNRYLMQSIIFYKENRYKKPEVHFLGILCSTEGSAKTHCIPL